MAYNQPLADRIRVALSHVLKVEEEKMFGGLAFLVDNKMCINAGADRSCTVLTLLFMKK